jgi:hypothetical protein
MNGRKLGKQGERERGDFSEVAICPGFPEGGRCWGVPTKARRLQRKVRKLHGKAWKRSRECSGTFVGRVKGIRSKGVRLSYAMVESIPGNAWRHSPERWKAFNGRVEGIQAKVGELSG